MVYTIGGMFNLNSVEFKIDTNKTSKIKINGKTYIRSDIPYDKNLYYKYLNFIKLMKQQTIRQRCNPHHKVSKNFPK